jgi:hypothetical protein
MLGLSHSLLNLLPSHPRLSASSPIPRAQPAPLHKWAEAIRRSGLSRGLIPNILFRTSLSGPHFLDLSFRTSFSHLIFRTSLSGPHFLDLTFIHTGLLLLKVPAQELSPLTDDTSPPQKSPPSIWCACNASKGLPHWIVETYGLGRRALQRCNRLGRLAPQVAEICRPWRPVHKRRGSMVLRCHRRLLFCGWWVRGRGRWALKIAATQKHFCSKG